MSRNSLSFARPFVLALLATTSGCGLAGYAKLKEVGEQNAAQAKANAEAGLARARTTMYANAPHVWMCPTAAQALAGTPCADGQEVLGNHDLTVVGQAPKDGVWPVSYWDAKGEHALFVAAAKVGDLPDLAALDTFEGDVAKRIPDAKRIPIRSVSFDNLLTQAGAFKGRYLVLRQPANTMTNKSFASGTFSFTIPIPVTTGSRWSALAQFELRNPTVTGEFQKGQRSYRCGPQYCDDFVMVAELTGKTVDRVDEFGGVRRLPVFAVREMGDRYGTYRAQ